MQWISSGAVVVTMAKQPGIILYLSEYQRIRNNLSQAQKGDLLDALMDFGDTEQEYQGDDPVVGVVFSLFSAAIRKANEKYDETCRQNAENVRKRWERRHAEDTTVYDRIRDDSTEYETYQTQTTNTNPNPNESTSTSKTKKVRFIPPTVDEVKAYCDERQNGIDPEQFVDYYTARGWEARPGQKIKDWKASVRTWERNKGRWTDEQRRGDHAENRIDGQRELYNL